MERFKHTTIILQKRVSRGIYTPLRYRTDTAQLLELLITLVAHYCRMSCQSVSISIPHDFRQKIHLQVSAVLQMQNL